MSKKNFENLTARQRAELAAQVKDVRLKLGFTQQELADAARVTRQSVGNIESGTMTPQAKTLIPVLEALGLQAKPAQFTPETSRWLAIVGGIIDSLPAEYRARAGQAAVSAVTTELVAVSNVRGAADTVDPHDIDLTAADLDLAATNDRSGIKEQIQPDYENQSQDPEDKQ